MNAKKGRPAMLEKFSGVITARIHDESDQNGEEGFTLIELLIVVIVLGILAAVTVFGLSGASSQSAAASCKSDVRTTEAAVDAYHAQAVDGSWPGTANNFADLTTPVWPSAAFPVTVYPKQVTPFLRTVPGNPAHYTITLVGAPTVTDGTVHVFVDNKQGGGAQDFDATINSTGTNLCDAVK
jgi:general secretion pathway protein G